ncbi:unnamed protein product [Parascedosporium putredinis]|uniref:Cytochrome P450 n=1 Tax=Parascedosporium putredinis TaxID=1442378 RepID=A0A9P1M943_9PEZI|nr:unnamed protein product [Parascedosporium putredinis]CAI7990118.1 unnamed protein product [Parascedosporium putredinis]
MLNIPIFVLVLAALAGAAIVTAVWKAFFSKLAAVPGPFLARFTDLWYSINDPMAAKIVYGTTSKFTKSSWYETWSNPHPNAWNLFGDRDAKRHAANRRQYQNTYSMSSLVNYESYVDDCADIFCQRLDEMSARGGWHEPVDMGHWLQCYAFDVICFITYSSRMGFLDLGEDVGEVMKNLEDHLAYASIVGVYPQLHPILFPIRNWLAGSQGKGRQYVINYTQQCMSDHQSKPKAQILEASKASESQMGSLDFLSKFMQRHSENPDAFSTYHALAGCVSNMVAGSDTTSISLSAILYHVLQNPWVEHSNKTIFGEDADKFVPERWLSEDKDRIAAMNRHWMPFGLGSRTCIGRHISMLEMSKLIPRLVRDFEMELSGKGTWETQNYWFVKPKNFKVLVRPRAIKT